MAIKLGTTDVASAFLGSTSLTQIYLGSDPLLAVGAEATIGVPSDVIEGADLDYPVTLSQSVGEDVVIEFETGDVSDTATEGEDYNIDPQHITPVGPQLTLDWQFAAQESLTDQVNNQTLTFTRASIGTFYDNLGVLKQAANDVARFDNAPNAGGALGLLIEEQSVNLCQQSETLDQMPWSGGGASQVTANQTTAPDGNLTADLVESLVGQGALSQPSIPVTPGVDLVLSYYIRNFDANRNIPRLATSTGNQQMHVLFASTAEGADIDSIAAPSPDVVDSGFENVGGGWWRVYMVVANNTNSTVVISLIPSNIANESNFWWGIQLEEASFATSYIPTGAASATRAQEDALTPTPGTLGAFYVADGSYFIDYQTLNPIGPGRADLVLHTEDAIGNNQVFLQQDNTAGRGARARTRELSNISTIDVIGTSKDRNKLAYRSADGDFGLSLNGAATVTDVGTGTPTGQMNRVLFGRNVNASVRHPQFWCAQASVYDGPLSDAELQALTSPQPTLDWNFAVDESLTDGKNGQTLTFTRASIATHYDAAGTLVQVANDAARFDNDPTALSALGLLIEEQRTNICLHSEDFTQAVWTGSGINNVTPNATTAPDGNLTADLLDINANGYVRQQVAGQPTGATNVAFTTYVKPDASMADGTQVRVTVLSDTGNLQADFSFTAGLTDMFITGITNCTAEYVTLPNGWFQLKVFGAYTRSTGICESRCTHRVGLTLCNFWGWQVEMDSAFPTSYIPTGAASATRAVEDCFIDSGLSALLPFPGTAFAAFQRVGGEIAGGNGSFLISNLLNNDSNSYRHVAVTGDTLIQSNYRSSGSGQAAINYDPVIAGQTNKLATRLAQDDVGNSFNGSATAVDTSANAPALPFDTIRVGGTTGANPPPSLNVGCMWFNQVSYYDVALDNASLEALTT